MEPINYILPHKFLINISEERLFHTNQEFEKHKIYGVERFPGLDGTKMRDNGHIRATEIAATLSHVEIIKIAKERDYPYVCIFEDDVIFDSRITDFERLWQEIPVNWDMLYFGAEHWKPGIPIGTKILKCVESFCLHAIVVRNTIYDEVIQVNESLEKTIDMNYAGMQGHRNMYCFHPNLAFQRECYSYIEKKIIKRKILL